MGKIVRLTESDLARIAKKVINEKSELTESCKIIFDKETSELEDLPSGRYKNVTIDTQGGTKCFKLYTDDGRIFVNDNY